jgi:class 3 adenylate cyclase
MIKMKSLQQKLIVFVILPVAIILSSIGIAGFFYIRDGLSNRWHQIAVLQMERAAQRLEIRLNNPINLIESFARAGREPGAEEIQGWLLKELQRQDGLGHVRLTWQGSGKTRTRVVKASPPIYFYPEQADALGLRSDLLDDAGQPVGRIEVQVKFDSLMQDLLVSGWMQTNNACLLDDQGNYLAHVDTGEKGRTRLRDNRDPVRLAIMRGIKEKPSGIISEGSQVIGFYHLKSSPLAIVLHAPGKQIITPVLRFGLIYPLGGIMSLLLILLFLRMGVRPMVMSIQEISRKAAQVAQGNYGNPLPVRSQDEIGQLTRTFNDMVTGLKERDFVTTTFGRYVDPEIARKLLQRPEASRLGGEKREVVVLFADIRGFTPLAEGLSPEATIHLLNRFFSEMIEVIQQHHGIIVDFLGDAIVAFFDPLDEPLPHTMRQALRCSLEMQQAMDKVNVPDGKIVVPSISMGIGLHAGDVVVGNIGSEKRAQYGIIGSAVNLASRIQNQAQGGEVVISPSIYRQVFPDVVVKREFETQLKGIKEPITLYAIQNLAE